MIIPEYLNMDPSNEASLAKAASNTQSAKALTILSKLCWMCSRLDFDLIFTASPSPKYEGKCSQDYYYSFSHFTSHNECPLCRIIADIISKSRALDQVRKSGVILNFEHSRSYIHLKTGSRNYLPELLVGPKTSDWIPHPGHLPASSEEMYGFYRQIQLILQPSLNDYTDGPGAPRFRRRVFEYAEFDIMKRWLDICKGSHGGKCNPVRRASAVENFEIRVIDVENRYIMSIDISSQYVALSYVWGGKEIPQLKLQASNFRRLSSSGSLKDGDIPTTVSDSIRVCQLLGRRYLWIDALCIMQDDPEEQASQIKEMHRIYANAEFTIVAAGGPDSWTGLPGMSKRDILQHVEILQPVEILQDRIVLGCLVNSLPSFTDSIMDSRWSTRAWTLQEMYFSRRLLYFTKLRYTSSVQSPCGKKIRF
jgi:hypothetical protein